MADDMHISALINNHEFIFNNR